MRPTSYLVDDRIAIDAGALTSGLSLREQTDVTHIFFSHSHIDHLFTLPFLLDNNFSRIKTPLTLYGPSHTLECLKEHLFNNTLWPDFTRISNERSSLLEMHPIKPGESVTIDGIRFTATPMVHTVPCYGYLIEKDDIAALICGDTASLDDALPLIRTSAGLKLVVLEASFPDRMKTIADLSRHLTTSGFAREVRKLPKGIRVLACHMKPDCLGEIQIEIGDLGLDHVSLIEQGAAYSLKHDTRRSRT